MVEGGGSTIVLYRISGGVRLVPHSHDFFELGLIISGRGQFLFEGESRTVREGDSFFIPAGGSHGFAVPEGGEPVVTMNVSVGVPGHPAGPSAVEIAHLTKGLVEPLAAAFARRQ